MRILVALWSVETSKDPHNASDSATRRTALRRVLDRVNLMLATSDIPPGQPFRAILVAPEYYFANPHAGNYHPVPRPEGFTFCPRTMSQDEKEALLVQLTALSVLYPDIIFMPGTVAWKKPFLRAPHERLKKDPITGARTGAPKGVSRGYKAGQSIQSYQGTPGEQGGGNRIASDLLRDTIIAALRAEGRFSVANYRAVLNEVERVKRLGGFISGEPVLRKLIRDANLPANCLDITPGPAEKLQAITSGTATHMMRNTAYLLHNGRVLFKYNKQGDFHESIGEADKTVFVPGGKAGSLVHAGYRFGLEICLDHNIGYLRYQVPLATPVDIHIVTSAAVENEDAHMNVGPGGFFLHASSNHNYTRVMHHKAGGGFVNITPHKHATRSVSGHPLEFWRIRLPDRGAPVAAPDIDLGDLFA